MTTPHPSPRTYPLASASKVLQRPSGESIRAFVKQMPCSGKRMLRPAAMAIAHSTLRKLWQAKCTATNDEEQAVSTGKQGPCKSRKYERRPGMVLADVPV